MASSLDLAWTGDGQQGINNDLETANSHYPSSLHNFNLAIVVATLGLNSFTEIEFDGNTFGTNNRKNHV